MMKLISPALARILNEETVQPRDLQMMGMLLPLGIEKGKEFKPRREDNGPVEKAAAEAHAWLMNKAATDTTPWWPGSQWVVPSPPITIPTEFKWETPNYFGVDARAIALSQYFCPTARLGTGSFYFGAFHDSNGRPLEGQNTYRLHVPANVRVREFWSMTVYGLKTSGFFPNSTRLTLGSRDKELRKNSDGSLDIYIGPKPPSGQDSNWLYTPPVKNGSRGFECMVRKRRSWTRAGGCRSLKELADGRGMFARRPSRCFVGTTMHACFAARRKGQGVRSRNGGPGGWPFIGFAAAFVRLRRVPVAGSVLAEDGNPSDCGLST